MSCIVEAHGYCGAIFDYRGPRRIDGRTEPSYPAQWLAFHRPVRNADQLEFQPGFHRDSEF